MLKLKWMTLGALALGLAAGLAQAQTTPTATNPTGAMPLYKVTVVGRTVTAVNYHVLGGKTSLDLRGTVLLPDARGKVEVEVLRGATHIQASFDKVNPAQRFGPEYLTYVMWAITPDGRPVNLGEVQLSGQSAAMDVTTTLQNFGLIVTAEPYFAVTQPSNLVVMENYVTDDTVGATAQVKAKYELLERGQYRLQVDPSQVSELPQDPKVPLDLYEAENAVRIARWSGADQYAATTYEKAAAQLQQAEDYEARNAGKTPVASVAREAVQTAEDARLMTIKDRQQQQVTDAEAASQAEATAAQSAQSAAQAEEATAQAAAQTAQNQTADAVAAQQQAVAGQQEAAANAAAAEKARLAAEQAQQAAQAAQQQAEQQTTAAQAETQQARAKLLVALNSVIETRDTATGLIMNMSDVLFDFNQATLAAGAQVKLAKISGILVSYPGLKIQVNGYTDSVGTDAYNQQLSDQRAAAVMNFLTAQGVAADSISSQGFGKADPVASNDTADGRQQNRRVEMVVSGATIGNGNR